MRSVTAGNKTYKYFISSNISVVLPINVRHKGVPTAYLLLTYILFHNHVTVLNIQAVMQTNLNRESYWLLVKITYNVCRQWSIFTELCDLKYRVSPKRGAKNIA